MRSLALLALILPALASAARAQSIIDVPGDYGTIQAALDAAQPGDTVKVAQGVWPGSIQLREDVTLTGIGTYKTILDGGGTGDVIVADGIHKFRVEKLTVRGAKQVGGNLGAGILINGSSSTTFGVTAWVERCRILDNGDGIRVTNVHTGTLQIIRNIIDRNSRHGAQLFIGTTLLYRNSILRNGGTGVHATAGSGLVDIRNNLIAFNDEYAVLRQAAATMVIAHNDAFDNDMGNYAELSSGSAVPFAPQPGTGELNVDPGLVSVENGDYHLISGSPLINAGDSTLGLDPDGTAPDIGAYPYLKLYVPASLGHGTSCEPVAGWFWEPVIGQSYFEVHVTQAPPGALAIMVVGVSDTLWGGLPLPFDLNLIGAPGCWILTGPIVTMTTLTDGLGAAQVYLPIPNDVVLAGAVLHHQWAVSSPTANPLGMLFSGAVASTIQP